MMRARIAQLTDTHLTATTSGRARGQDVWANLGRALADLQRHEPIDLLALTGDIANERAPATYAQLAELLRPWRDRVRVLPGNHDSRELLRVAFGERAGRFSVALAGWRVLGLDSLRRPFVHGRLGKEQLAWLAAELGESAEPTLILVHHPPIRVGAWWLDKDLLRDRRALAAVVTGRNVRAFACGHVHQEHEGSFAGASVWTTPSTAYQFVPRSFWPARITQGVGYRLLELDDERIATRVVRL